MKVDNQVVRKEIRVSGIVQGVGFRPFVFNLAAQHGLAGCVRNDAEGVTIEVEGEPAALSLFFEELSSKPPPLARIDDVRSKDVEAIGEIDFRILHSEGGGEHSALISPDMSICEQCLAEIREPAARRYRYPFTNCTNCGPRFTITKDIPYDRPNTTMAGFQMCSQCRAEYLDPRDRRFHAQPIACPLCGPRLRLSNQSGAEIDGDALNAGAEILAGGGILAVKGLGGFHLACDALNEKAVSALRSRKHREEKPFALMADGLARVREFCRMSEEDIRILTGRRRPIVLLERLTGSSGREGSTPGVVSGAVILDAPESGIAASVAPGNRYLGFMLPYTPLHFLLLDEFVRAGGGGVLVMTSGNVSDEPIAFTEEAAFEDLNGIADAYLTHNRPIYIRCDDSVVRTFRNEEMLMRRARGYAPEPVRLPLESREPVLAVGAELKHTFCLAKADRAFLSHHIGDLENWETMKSFLEGVEHFSRIFEMPPQAVAYDLHPEYLSTKWALGQVEGSERPAEGVDLRGAPAFGVQHHHAHIASCLADNATTGPVIGLALDGTGWGEDGTIWGCEILVADLVSFRRAGYLKPVPLAGGAAAIKEPWRMAAVYLNEAFGAEAAHLGIDFVRRTAEQWDPVLDMAAKGLNTLPTSSAGRLFDAIAAVSGLKGRVFYEGQAAIELEQAADPADQVLLPVNVARSARGEPVIIDGVALFRAVCERLASEESVQAVSGAFHNTLAASLVRACELVGEEAGLRRVALSGGTFQNQILLEKVTTGLEEIGFKVLRHRSVPANDGGISLGQATVAAARMATEA